MWMLTAENGLSLWNKQLNQTLHVSVCHAEASEQTWTALIPTDVTLILQYTVASVFPSP